MKHYRFIAKRVNDDNAKLIAFATQARDRGHAQANARYRFSEDHEIISVNVKVGDKWSVIEGVDVLADALEPHHDMTPGLGWEGSAEKPEDGGFTFPVREPVKRPGYHSQDMHLTIQSADALTDDLLERTETLPADKNPLIVNLLFLSVSALTMLLLGTFFHFGDRLSAMDAALTSLSLFGWPLMACLIGGFALRYLAGIHNTLRREELRQLASSAEAVSQSASDNASTPRSIHVPATPAPENDEPAKGEKTCS
ncbi:MAG: hypothetical protein AWU57_543 [Marinobacter sp. T13-3]|nr:MAG: hypothetical protein AWU57_543 [Marinobacter sp. T13-3]